MPSSGFISITDNGADPSGKNIPQMHLILLYQLPNEKEKVNMTYFCFCFVLIVNKGVWIPQGLFLVNTHFVVNNITIRGAGPWYLILKTDFFSYHFVFSILFKIPI